MSPPRFYSDSHSLTHVSLGLQTDPLRFISALPRLGLSGSQAIWANRKYHSHQHSYRRRDIIAEVKRSVALQIHNRTFSFPFWTPI